MDGIDEARVSAWFADNIEGATPPLSFDLIAGGRSNLTYRVTDSVGHDYALRRPPISHVLPTAHDMGREHRVIAALGPTPVPVPPALGYCADTEVNGAPFYVMGYVEGHVLRDADEAARTLTEGARRRAGERLLDVLASIHAVDVDAVGLGDLGRRDGYIARQLRRWYGQFTQSQEGTGRPVPAVEEVHARLSEAVPPQREATIVHGDYRLDNTMLGDDGEVLAVLDWEICTLGDPLADVGLLHVYWSEGDEDNPLLGSPVTALPGFPHRDELMARYERASGRSLADLDFYVAFGYWKLACILEGVYARYLGGAGGGDRTDYNDYADKVVQLADLASQVAARL